MAVPKGYIYRPLFDRFIDKIQFFEDSDCWSWTGAQDGHGYGQIDVGGRPDKAHRVAWRLFVGPITEESIDHLCRTRSCVNPDHLEPVSLAENSRRQAAATTHHNALKTHCPNGHPYNEDNTRFASSGYGRVCRICRKASNRRYRIRLKEQRANAA